MAGKEKCAICLPGQELEGTFRARVFLVCTLLGLALYLLISFGIIQELL